MCSCPWPEHDNDKNGRASSTTLLLALFSLIFFLSILFLRPTRNDLDEGVPDCNWMEMRRLRAANIHQAPRSVATGRQNLETDQVFRARSRSSPPTSSSSSNSYDDGFHEPRSLLVPSQTAGAPPQHLNVGGQSQDASARRRKAYYVTLIHVLAFSMFVRVLNKVNQFYESKEAESLEKKQLHVLLECFMIASGGYPLPGEPCSDCSLAAWKGLTVVDATGMVKANEAGIKWRKEKVSSLNLLAFRKILKKFDKVSNEHASATYLKAVNSSNFISSEKVARLADEVESLFSMHFTGNDRKMAMKY
ncbi:Phosphate transporter [Nymphaea thermarum]|nr:Phosphate transporter [Nymphaea thermarum]